MSPVCLGPVSRTLDGRKDRCFRAGGTIRAISGCLHGMAHRIREGRLLDVLISTTPFLLVLFFFLLFRLVFPSSLVPRNCSLSQQQDTLVYHTEIPANDACKTNHEKSSHSCSRLHQPCRMHQSRQMGVIERRGRDCCRDGGKRLQHERASASQP